MRANTRVSTSRVSRWRLSSPRAVASKIWMAIIARQPVGYLRWFGTRSRASSNARCRISSASGLYAPEESASPTVPPRLQDGVGGKGFVNGPKAATLSQAAASAAVGRHQPHRPSVVLAAVLVVIGPSQLPAACQAQRQVQAIALLRHPLGVRRVAHTRNHDQRGGNRDGREQRGTHLEHCNPRPFPLVLSLKFTIRAVAASRM